MSISVKDLNDDSIRIPQPGGKNKVKSAPPTRVELISHRLHMYMYYQNMNFGFTEACPENLVKATINGKFENQCWSIQEGKTRGDSKRPTSC